MSQAAQTFPPYWTRFGSFFAYPFSTGPLLVCLGSAVACAFIELVGWVFQAIFLVLLGGAILRYAFGVLERTARGLIEDDLALYESEHGGKYLPYKQWVAILIAVIIAGLTSAFAGPHPGLIVLAGLGLLWPANTMVLALTNSLGDSLAFPKLWFVVRSIGLPYLGLCGCLLLLTFGSAEAMALLAPAVPRALLGAVAGLVFTYFTLVMFRLMGYVLYQYHEVLGFSVKVEKAQLAAGSGTHSPGSANAERTAALLREGRYDEAIQLARNEWAANPDDPGANQRLHRLLLAVPGQDEALLEHARNWLERLLAAGNVVRALEVLDGVWRRQPDFRPTAASALLPLAEAAYRNRRYDQASRLIQGFDRRFPKHPDTPAVYLLGARLLIEHHRDEAQAGQVLAFIRQRFPDSPAAQEAAQLEELLARLQALPGTTAPTA